MPEPIDDLPAALASPARRALKRAGITRLDELAEVSEAELYRMHGAARRPSDSLGWRSLLAGQGWLSDACLLSGGSVC